MSKLLHMLALAALISFSSGQLLGQYYGELSFDLTRTSATSAPFELEGFEHLAFSTTKLESFEWTTIGEDVGELDEAGIFSEFRELLLGYDPMNRDRGEIRVYAARILPERLGLAADYARLLALQWAPTAVAVEPHDADFGEVIGLRTTPEGEAVTRITVMRRGDELLIVRAAAAASEWSYLAPLAARFVGSIQFEDADRPDPLLANFRDVAIAIPAEAGLEGTLDFSLPPQWEELDLRAPTPSDGVVSFFVDRADADANNGAMVYSFDVGSNADQLNADTAVGFAPEILDVFLQNMLPSPPAEIRALDMLEFEDLAAVSDHNSYHVYIVRFEEGPAAAAHVLVVRKGNQVIGFVSIAAEPVDLETKGGGLNGTFVNARLQQAIRSYLSDADTE